MLPIVTITLLLPLLGAACLLAWRQAPPRAVHTVGIVTAALTLAGAAVMWWRGVRLASNRR